jgi:hypothetical protein
VRRRGGREDVGKSSGRVCEQAEACELLHTQPLPPPSSGRRKKPTHSRRQPCLATARAIRAVAVAMCEQTRSNDTHHAPALTPPHHTHKPDFRARLASDFNAPPWPERCCWCWCWRCCCSMQTLGWWGWESGLSRQQHTHFTRHAAREPATLGHAAVSHNGCAQARLSCSSDASPPSFTSPPPSPSELSTLACCIF